MSALKNAEDQWLCRLRQNPNDIEALLGIAQLAARDGKLDAALLATERAAQLAPNDIDVALTLAHVYHDRTEWTKAQQLYRRVLEHRPCEPLAHEGACYVAMRLGDEALAAFHRERAFCGRAITVAPYLGSGQAINVLLVVSAHGGNFDTRPYLHAEKYAVTKIVAEYFHENDPLPKCDIVLNAIGDADRSESALKRLSAILRTSEIPVINHPDRVLLTTRAHNNRRFAQIAGVIAPKTLLVQRADVMDEEAIATLIGRALLSFPLLVRIPGFHTGQYCERVTTIKQLQDIVAAWNAQKYLISEWIDVRSGDGYVRKYRCMSIAGQLYPLHLAASLDWKVHYMTSAMAEIAALRDEESAFLQHPEASLGTTAWRALQSMNQALGLEYAGIDFGINCHGQLVFFEANATMIIPFAPADQRWEYRRMVPPQIHAAVDCLITNSHG